MRSGIKVVEGGILDLDEVMHVMEDSFDPAYGEAWTGPQCAGLMPMPGVWVSLARDGEGIVGFALGRVVAGEAASARVRASCFSIASFELRPRAARVDFILKSATEILR
jgi:hypothetical protein